MTVDYGLVNRFRARVAERLNEDTSLRTGLTDEDATEHSRVLIDEELRAYAVAEAAANRPLLTADEEREHAKAVHDALFGLGPLQRLVDDPTIENININGFDEVWIKYASIPGQFARGRQRWPEPLADSDTHLEELIRHAATYLGGSGRSFNRSQPQLDMQLPGGHRLSAVMSVSSRPVISIRRHTILDPGRARLTTLEELQAIEQRLRLFLRAAVLAKMTIIIAGGTNAGKTTLLRALANEIPPDERLITIEKARGSSSSRPGSGGRSRWVRRSGSSPRTSTTRRATWPSPPWRWPTSGKARTSEPSSPSCRSRPERRRRCNGGSRPAGPASRPWPRSSRSSRSSPS